LRAERDTSKVAGLLRERPQREAWIHREASKDSTEWCREWRQHPSASELLTRALTALIAVMQQILSATTRQDNSNFFGPSDASVSSLEPVMLAL
jgi:hypothetical protein